MTKKSSNNKFKREIFTEEEYNEVLKLFKHNISQNMRIARKLSNIDSETAAERLFIEPQSLRRIEALNDRDEFSIKVFIMAVLTYDVNPDFYFEDYRINEKLLDSNKSSN